MIYLIFSKDRPLQLELALSTCKHFSVDWGKEHTVVLYKTSDERYQKAYDDLEKNFQDVEFIKQYNFMSDVLNILSLYANGVPEAQYFLKYENGIPDAPPSLTRFFPYQLENKDYLLDYIAEYDEHKSIIEKYGFPKPYDFDLIKKEGDKQSFIFHYKSASWHDRYGDGYNSHSFNKKLSLKRLLKIEDENAI